MKVLLSRGGCDKTVELIGKIDGLKDASEVALSLTCHISNEEAIAAMVDCFWHIVWRYCLILWSELFFVL